MAASMLPQGGVLALQIGQQRLHLLALRLALRAAQVARQDGERRARRRARPDRPRRSRASGRMTMWRPSSVSQARRHRRQLAAEEQIQQQRLERVVAVMAQRDLVAAELGGRAVQDPAPQPRTERAVGLPLGDLLGDDGVGVLVQDAGAEHPPPPASAAAARRRSRGAPGPGAPRAARKTSARGAAGRAAAPAARSCLCLPTSRPRCDLRPR